MIQQYYLEGKALYLGGVTVMPENPYTPGSAPAESWEAGWTDAWYDDLMNGDN